ncbi:DUF4377 domain-containing protein [Flavobacterium sp. '19STA2R22 D10 B1']|uniref:DUF4377 domain-containing protein n=1 Tax=Flavobacterium aerium TaxID=3037261 RepID=UPI00278C39F4|nr:DUF4377 domain-containing protein [Flavobacterium sp. '19STA2R22 D10 B1']
MKKSIMVMLLVAFLNIQCNPKKTETPTETKTEVATDSTKVAATAKEVAPSMQYGMIVASKRVDCQGVAKQKCMLTKSVGGTKWELFYDSIEGFTYEEGYEYHLEVLRTAVENPPADASAFHYKLVNVIAKEKKNSDIRMENEKPTFESTWDLVSLDGKAIKGFIAFNKDGSLNANAGCNGMFGIKFKADAAKKAITFDTKKSGSTLMACPEDRDHEFTETLAKVTHFEEVSKTKMLLKIKDKVVLELSR